MYLIRLWISFASHYVALHHFFLCSADLEDVLFGTGADAAELASKMHSSLMEALLREDTEQKVSGRGRHVRC